MPFQRGASQMSSSIDVIVFFRDVMLTLNPKIRSAATVELYEVDIAILQQYFAMHYPQRPEVARPVQLADLSATLIAGAAAWQVKRGRAPTTANRLIRHIGSIWRFAFENKSHGYAVSEPQKIHKHREAKRLPEAWSSEEFQKIIAVACELPGYVGGVPASVWWPALLLTSYWTGCRITALMKLPTNCVDFSRGEIRVPAEIQKQFSDQGFELPAEVMQLLTRIDPVGRKLPTLFFDWPFDRTVRQWRRLCEHYSKILVKAGLPSDRRHKFHCIRRTTATYIASKRGIAEAQMFLGHSSVTTTKRYVDPRFMERPRVSSVLPQIAVTENNLRIVG